MLTHAEPLNTLALLRQDDLRREAAADALARSIGPRPTSKSNWPSRLLARLRTFAGHRAEQGQTQPAYR
jgi:hypothetical protein